jgi:hypothetical protein
MCEKKYPKIAVDVVPETSEMLQKIAFRNGYTWLYGSRNIAVSSSPRLFFARWSRDGLSGKIITHTFDKTRLYGTTLVDINEAIEFIKQKDEPILKAGDYIFGRSLRVYLITEINETGITAKSVACKDDDTPVIEFTKLSYDVFISSVYSRHATEEEIKEALKTEWERRLGDRESFTIRSLGRGIVYRFPRQRAYTYYVKGQLWGDDSLYYNHVRIYKQGKWAEIEDAPEMIGGYKVELDDRCLVIGGQRYRRNRIRSAIGLPGLKKLVFEDCSGNEIEITEKEARRLYNKFFGGD